MGALKLIFRKKIVLGLLISMFSILVYLADRKSLLVGKDTEINVILPVAMIKYRSLTIEALKFPHLFSWKLKNNKNMLVPIPIHSMEQNIDGFQASDLYRVGVLLITKHYYNLVKTESPGSYANIFGIGVGFAALPFYALVSLYDPTLLNSSKMIWHIGKVAAAIYVGLSVFLIFLILNLYISTLLAVIITLSYALGTCVFSIASQAFWQQTPELFFLTLTAYFFVVFMRRPSYILAFLTGLALGLAAFCRPLSFLLSPLFFIYFFWNFRRQLIAWILGFLPFVILQLSYNYFITGNPWNFGQTDMGKRIALSKTGLAEVWQWSWEGLLGVLFSPSRGLFVFSPIFLFSLFGIVKVFRDEKWRSLRLLAFIPLVIVLVQASWFDWWGGWTFGYRPLLSLCPLLALYIAPALESLKGPLYRVLFAIFLTWSLGVQIIGVYSYDLSGWNRNSCDVDKIQCRKRLWSIQDNQISYYFNNFFEARKHRIQNLKKWIREDDHTT